MVTPNRWAKLNGFVDRTLRDLKPAEVRVWLIIFRDLKADGTARTGQTDIASRGGLSVRAVGTAVRSLTARGLLQVVRRGTLNCGPSVYRIRGFSAAAAGEAPSHADDAIATAEPPSSLAAATVDPASASETETAV